MIRMTAAELRTLADRIENENLYHCKRGVVDISIKKHPNGREYIEFEQPSVYAECNGAYYRYDAK